MNNETTKNRVWTIGWVVGILLCVFLGVVSLKEIKSIAYVGRDIPAVNTITLNGKGEAISVPNIATFSFGVTETGKTVDEAQTKATTKVNTAVKALKDNGVADKDIKTTSYNINPHYDYTNGVCVAGGICQPGKSVLNGYDVSQTTEVKIRDLKKAGSLFTTIGALDVQNVNSLTFSIDDIDSVKATARKIAIDDAQQKAQEMQAQQQALQQQQSGQNGQPNANPSKLNVGAEKRNPQNAAASSMAEMNPSNNLTNNNAQNTQA